MHYLGYILSNSEEFKQLYNQYKTADIRNLYSKLEPYINTIIEESEQISVKDPHVSDHDDSTVYLTFEIIFNHHILGQYQLDIIKTYFGYDPQEGVDLIAEMCANSKQFIEIDDIIEHIIDNFPS